MNTNTEKLSNEVNLIFHKKVIREQGLIAYKELCEKHKTEALVVGEEADRLNQKYIEELSKTDLQEIDFYKRREQFLESQAN